MRGDRRRSSDEWRFLPARALVDPLGRQLVRAADGFSLVELLVAIALLSILTATAVSHLDNGIEANNTYMQDVIANLRYARSQAITTGTHFTFHWVSTGEYQIQRLQLSGTTWTFDRTVKDVKLPGNVLLWGSWPQNIEFNTRGMVVTPNYIASLATWDTTRSIFKLALIWPSGQVYEWD